MKHQIPKVFKPLFNKARYKVFYGGRGGGKSWAVARVLLLKAWEGKQRILCTRELQGSIKDSVHKLLSDQISRMGLSYFYEVTRDSIRGKNGSEFLFLGIKHDPQKIKSLEGVDIAWVEEAQKVSDESWKVLIPTIRKDKSEIWVTFNPSQKTDPTFQRFIENPPSEAIIKKVSWRDNPYFNDIMLKELEDHKDRDYDDYLHVWEGEIKTIADGAIYGKQLKQAREDGRITTVPIEPYEVHTFWDLGRNDHTAIWFMQRVGLQNRFIDYYEDRLVDLEHYARVLSDKAYKYGEHYMPHDVEVQVLGMSENRRVMFENLGVKPIITVPRIAHVNTGIDLTRKAFASCWFDEKRCEKGIDALSNYQYVFDEQHNTHRQTPLHNWASNGADAFRQFAQGFVEEDEDWGDIQYTNHGIV